MKSSSPKYHLFSESGQNERPGYWRFVLRDSEGSDPLVVGDVEPDVRGERLELLSVVRGLEALDQPSRVTLMTPSRYVREGIRYGLEEWRENDWHWESFGRMVPLKNGDLWQRVDRAMEFHQIECRTWRFDPPHVEITPPKVLGRPPANGPRMRKNQWQRLIVRSRRRIRSGLRELARVACV